MPDPTLYNSTSKINGWIQIAKIGKFPQGDLTHDIFNKVCKNFNTQAHEPPYTVGHITSDHNDKPAMGWISGLKVAGDFLFAKGKQIANDLDNWVREGRYKKRSIGLRYNQSGEPYLHHVAWLGSAVPACKGLSNVYATDENYQDTDGGTQKVFENDFYDIKFDDPKPGPTPGPNPGETKMEYSEAQIIEMKDKAAAEAKAKADKDYVEKLKTEKETAVKEAEDKLNKQYADNADAAEAKLGHDKAVTDFVDKLVKEKKVTPGMRKAGLDQFLFSMIESKEINYTEDKKEIKTDQFTVIKKIFEALPQYADDQIQLEDPEKGPEGDDAVYKEEKKRANALIEKEEKAERHISYGEALKTVRAEMKAEFADK